MKRRSHLHNLCPPPRRFRPAGRVLSAQFSYPPSFVIQRKPKNRARAEGVRYEKLVHKRIAEVFCDECVIAPWIVFTSDRTRKKTWCQPDALLVDIRQGIITVIEIKIKHTSDAWWQVRHLYTPVTKFIFGSEWKYNALEITCWFDPHTKFPERFDFLKSFSPHAISSLDPGKFYVYIWNGRKF